MRPVLAAGLLASLLVAAVVKPWPPAPPQIGRVDVEEVYQFDGVEPFEEIEEFDASMIGPGEDRPAIIVFVPVDTKEKDGAP